jgi:hypothetical protein
MCAVDGFTVMEAKVAVVTVRAVEPVTAPVVAEIVEVPLATLLAKP